MSFSLTRLTPRRPIPYSPAVQSSRARAFPMTFTKHLLFAIALATGGSSIAQTQSPPASTPTNAVVGKGVRVEGLVTVSYGSQVATVVDGSPMVDRSRYVTSSSGRLTLSYEDGCDVQLEPNQWAEVDSAIPCARRRALVYSLNDPQLAGLFSGGNAARTLGVALLFGAAVSAARDGGTPPRPTP